MRFTICTTEAVVSVHSAVLLLVLPLSKLTDISSSQRWVIYSQTNGAVSNYTYLFRFVWFVCFLACCFVFGFVIVFSDLLFCFRICHCVFWLVIMFSGLLLCFLNCYFVFYICICVCNLLFCFQNCDLFCTSRPPYVCRASWKIRTLGGGSPCSLRWTSNPAHIQAWRHKPRPCPIQPRPCQRVTSETTPLSYTSPLLIPHPCTGETRK